MMWYMADFNPYLSETLLGGENENCLVQKKRDFGEQTRSSSDCILRKFHCKKRYN